VNIFSGQDNALLGASRVDNNSQRPNVSGNPKLSFGRSRGAQEAEYFNTSAFSQPAAGQFGTTGRNSIVGPGALQNDFSVMKNLVTLPHEMGGFQFRADMFNLINWTNLGQPQNYLNSSAFGQITSAGPPRIAQFALRYDF
jgi:hypothetical protein